MLQWPDQLSVTLTMLHVGCRPGFSTFKSIYSNKERNFCLDELLVRFHAAERSWRHCAAESAATSATCALPDLQ